MKKGTLVTKETDKAAAMPQDTILQAGDPAPAFQLPKNGDDTLSSAALKNKAYVLYFYPKDDTSGCTREAIDFSALKPKFDAIGVSIIGVSPDNAIKHDKFIKKHDLSVELLADEEKTLSAAYGTWVEKSMYGRKYMGVERSTFLIGTDGKIAQVWRKVKVPGHAEAVLQAAQELSAG